MIKTFGFLGLWLISLAGLPAAQEQGTRGLVPIPSVATTAGKTYALLIGISRYQKVQSLEYADKDAELFASFLESPMGGLVHPNVFLLENERATRAGIDDAIKSFVAPHAAPENSLIVFVAGHGVYLKTEEDPETRRMIERDPYILTYDSNPQDANTTGYPMSEFRQMVAEQALHYGRVLVFADVCHADNIAGIGGGSELQDAVRKVFEGRAGDLDLMVASYARKYAFEATAIGGGHGAFSYFLISGMNGSAAFSGADAIRWNELAHYVTDQVFRYTGGKQSPRDFPSRDDLIVIADLRRKGIVLEPVQPLSLNDVRSVRSRHAYIPPVVLAAETDRRSVGADGRNTTRGSDAVSDAIARGNLISGDGPQGSAETAQSASLARSASAMIQQLPAGSPQRQEAERSLRVALEDAGQQIISRYLEGDQIPQSRPDFDRCARLFETAAPLEPAGSGSGRFDQSRALFCRGRAMIFDRQYADAEKLLRESIRLDPRRSYAWNAIGISRLEQIQLAMSPQDAARSFDEAAAAFRTAIRFAPYWAYPRHNLALTYSERGDFDHAFRNYREAMEIAPHYSYLPYNLGLLYTKTGDFAEARRWFETAGRIAAAYRRLNDGRWTERANVLNALGNLELEQNRRDKARQRFEEALTADPRNVNARHNLAMLLAERGDYARADELWNSVANDAPDFLEAPIARAQSLAARGDTAAAIEGYKTVLRQASDWPGAHEALARLYLVARNSDDALTEVSAALRLTPRSVSLLELRGDVQQLSGRIQEARADWREALATHPDKSAAKRLRKKLSQAGS